MLESMSLKPVTGSCLCGEVRFEVNGPLRGVVNCHCAKCRRFHGPYGVYTSVSLEHLVLTAERGLKRFRSLTDETPDVHRGFCRECGSLLFWHPKDQDRLAIAAGSLDEGRGLQTTRHVWLSQKSDDYDLCDNLAHFDKGWAAMTGSKVE
jgi:hypothetical protein